MKITSPVEGLNDHTAIGPVTLEFKDSVAEVDELPDGVVAYLKENGYGIDGSTPKGRKYKLGQADPADPRKVSQQRVGTATRDGAVSPKRKDFLGPSNAGKANPHGTKVVNPEIHASEGIRPVKAGEVHVDDPKVQDAAEKAHAAAATDGTPVVLTAEEQELLGVGPDGRPLPEGDADSEVQDWELKGDALAAKLDELGLSNAGTADEQRDRIRISQTPAADLAGKDLESALRDAELPVSGSADDRRTRLQEYRDKAQEA